MEKKEVKRSAKPLLVIVIILIKKKDFRN